MSADFRTKHFLGYSHPQQGYIHIVWRDGGAEIGNFSPEELRELQSIGDRFQAARAEEAEGRQL